ncbi:MAG: D-glycero-beta-D-manno-heptose 1-phosphate adenylyltransferase [Alphaproteobacteria bacterium CG_4_10_14_0_2_um_filter_63_37]|nr:MAG: D-beta-D-heptose 1-phosphate adenosyltransferase [Proteobacteria bacterium CG1_02_64_396]PJA24116.1 MAG: D-glycero-beta-D-manno-heptose 1-phosphate adenylyltransferase [Alphaproteobacteria bacterium CG_4_10_14_0_2_um_filter_63_37]
MFLDSTPPWAQAHLRLEAWRRTSNARVVFTNGCFDILHPGHVTYLDEARALGTHLVLGLNTDASVQRLKGPKRPIHTTIERATVLAGLRSVDLVVPFDQDTPLELILALQPDVLVKGGDWAVEQILGGKEVIAWGGEVRSLPFVDGKSTSGSIERIIERYCPKAGTSS